MRVLVTGGAGFIGSHLCDHLLADNHVVSVIDNLSTGRLENIEHLMSNPAFRFEVGSILNEKVLTPLIEETDVVFHLAAAVGVQLILKDPVCSIETNIRGTEIVLDLAARRGTRVLLASTSEVYGKSKKIR